MFIELLTNKGELITFNSANIVLFAPAKKSTLIVDVNGMDFYVLQSYETVKAMLGAKDYDSSYVTD